LTAWHQNNDERRAHHLGPQSLMEYLDSGDFVEDTFETWESEFLDDRPDAPIGDAGAEGVGAVEGPCGEGRPTAAITPVALAGAARGPGQAGLGALPVAGAESAVRRLVSLHAVGVRKRFNQEAVEHGQTTVTLPGYLGSSTLWFESFQNWRSEFLSIGVLVVLSIFLRREGSPESKPVAAPHAQTGA
jgi:hypothetical protein